MKRSEHPWLSQILLGLVLVSFAIGAGLWAGSAQQGWAPPGAREADPGFGSSSDWAKRWNWAVLDLAAREQGERLYWDPFSGFGGPVYADPELYVRHPAWLLFSSVEHAGAGFDGLLLFSISVLSLGLVLLGRRLGIPAPLAASVLLVPVCSMEWGARLGSGHITFLGATTWPLVCALLLVAIGHARDTNTRSSLEVMLLGTLAGLALSLAPMIGGHYALPFGMLLSLVIIWAAGAPRWSHLAVISLFILAWTVHGAPRAGRFVVDVALLILIGLGLWKSDRFKLQIVTGIGLAVGLIAGSGRFLLAALGRADEMGRIMWGLVELPPVEIIPWSHYWTPSETRLDLGLLYAPNLYWWFGAALGVVALIRAHAALGTAVATTSLIGLSAGNPLLPWDVIGNLPGMSATFYLSRLQWVLLMLAPLGLAWLVAGLARLICGVRPGAESGWRTLSDRRSLAAWILCLLVAWSVVHVLGNYRRFDIADPEAEAIPLPPLASGVVGYDGADPDAAPPTTIWASLDGLIRQGGLEEEQMPPTESGGRLHWTIRDGQPHPAPEDVDIDPSLDAWTVSGSPGEVVVLAQRATPGWRCDGAKLVDDKTLLDPARHEELFAWSWLTVELGDSGTGRCRWRPTSFVGGTILQSTGLLMVIGLVGVVGWRRRGVGSGSSSTMKPR